MEDTLPLEESALGAISRQLSGAIFMAFPELRNHARMHQSKERDGLSLSIVVPSPTNDPNREICIWVDEVSTPSIGFGSSHTHESPNKLGMNELLDKLRAILEDKLVIIEDIGGKFPSYADWIDLRQPQALEDELTGEFSPGRVLLKPWSGKNDQEVDISELTI
jgi:hypothetical protein